MHNEENLFSRDIEFYVNKAIQMMHALKIPVRDTLNATKNLDDFYSNNSSYGGTRLLKIEWGDVPHTSASANKIYSISGFKSAAHDAYKITIPFRLKDSPRDDHLIHECVHYLQHTTVEEDRNYIAFNGHNYVQYVSQRVEIEAHIVQILYIFSERTDYLNTLKVETQKISAMLDEYISTRDNFLCLQIILESKRLGII